MITLAVLAGGEGRRMGAPKDTLQDQGRPVLEALLRRLKWRGPNLLVAPHGGRRPAGHALFDRIVNDSVPGQGPLRGILTALLAAETECIVCIPVDMPGLATEHLEWIAARLDDHPSEVGVLPARFVNGDRRIEPFPNAFRLSAGPLVKSRLEAGTLALHQLAEEPRMYVIDTPPEWSQDVWRNVNQPGDLPDHWTR